MATFLNQTKNKKNCIALPAMARRPAMLVKTVNTACIAIQEEVIAVFVLQILQSHLKARVKNRELLSLLLVPLHRVPNVKELLKKVQDVSVQSKVAVIVGSTSDPAVKYKKTRN